MPRLFRQPLEMILADNTASETVRADAAITLAEMGYDSEEVMEFVNAHSNDPTELGRRARGILNGHNILDEVLTRARMMHPDFGEKEVRRYAIEAAKGMTNALDRHTTFFDEEAVKSWEESRTGEYGGIGAYVSVVEGFFVISRPFYNGPAYEAGLRSGDRIIEVNGEEMMGDDLNYLVSKLKGTPGTEVNVKIFRRGWTSPREFTLTRAKIDVPNIHVTSLPGDLGYIRLDSFSQKATEQMEQALSDISASDAKGLVLDLRGNPGGGLMTAVDIALNVRGGPQARSLR
ncbi:MAG: S41 family peptidase [Planctomycetota bacterium]|nr:S41 family peptidase [Planctomycetota bacterium]